MHRFVIVILILSIFSCIPVSIAPKIKGQKIVKAKRFKRDLPKDYSFIIEDPKDADEFYNFINIKYDCGYIDVDTNVPFQIGNQVYYLSFFEREKVSRTWNLIPIVIDLKRESNGNDPMLEDIHVTRKGKWYIVMTISNEKMEDCLAPKHESRQKVVSYLKNLRHEYYSTHNYIETYLKRE
jgi:hypothetical protein